MYLKNLKLWNFRKYGGTNNGDLSNIDFLDKPDLDLNFNKHLNVLIGENDSGKTAIIDAIKLVLKTHSYEFLRVEEDDFYKQSSRFRIEIIFSGMETKEAAHFTECISVDLATGEESLRLIYAVRRVGEKIYPSDIRAGADIEGKLLTAEAREYLLATYLKPLRDAKNELIAKKNSRLSNIFAGHEAFKGRTNTHILMGIFKDFNNSIESYFKGTKPDGTILSDLKGKELKDKLDGFMKEFSDFGSNIGVTGGKELKEILEKLELSIADYQNPGLGILNRLFIASELIHLERGDWTGLKLGLIEELEAHINPQNQMRVIESLYSKKDIQLIISTHSPNLASKVKVENLILCHQTKAFPMGHEYTKLKSEDYKFLERFLDSTKSNLFFAKGVILVEGWAEELILPELAKKLKEVGIISKDLTEAGVSIVNVGSDTFFRYAQIFRRNDGGKIEIPVAIITDLDLRPELYEKNIENLSSLTGDDKIKKLKDNQVISGFNNTEIDSRKEQKAKNDGDNVKTFLSPHWTLEYCIGLSERLSPLLFESIKEAIKEMRVSGYTMGEETREYSAILGDNKEKAFEIYDGILNKKKVSKSIVAQQFSEKLKNETISRVDLESDPNISYLINAIKHAIGS